MTGIQTGVIAILGTLLKDDVTRITRRWALLTLSCFVLSIFATVWLVLMLPSVLARLPRQSMTTTTALYDISMHHLFSLRVGTFATFTHVCFMAGIICFAACIYSRSKPMVHRPPS